MKFVRIQQYRHRPSLMDAALAMKRERRGWLAEQEPVQAAFEQAERELTMLDAQVEIETAPAPKKRHPETPQPQPEPVKFLRGLAESTVVIDEEENLTEPDAQGLDAQDDPDEQEIDEDERSERAADAAAQEEENPEGEGVCTEIDSEDSF